MLIEAEKRNIFSATVVTTNHRIKQPLTLMSLSSTAIKREINKDIISREEVLKKLNYIDIAIKEITDILNQLNAIKQPVFSEYIKDIRMVDVPTEMGKISD
jgi:two-component system cell cycle response regulator